ncbi:MAG: hypothetical protein CHACPFDD_01841 [Phycisphaerae bacterium]|nr:hypothetical protein [Phycisphaerae bacterium]
MNRMLISLIFGVVAATPSLGTTYTFIATSGSWDNTGNWSPNGKPGAGDEAIIPSGKTCRIENEDAAVKLMQIAGTLGLEGYSLTLGDTDADSSLNLTGTIYFNKPSTEVPELLIYNTITTTGSGTITARVVDSPGDEGVIGDADSPANSGLVVGNGTILVGSLTILVDITNRGTIHVNHGSDTLVLGGSEAPPTNAFVGDDGNLEVSGGGTVRINAMEVDGDGTWTVTGNDDSLLWLTDKFTIGDTGTFYVNVRAWRGTLDIDADFLTRGALHFGNLTLSQEATIKVASGKAAEFSVD